MTETPEQENTVSIINLNDMFMGTGSDRSPMPKWMSVPMMRRLLGGKFPDANGFAWDMVAYFKFEDGHWEPYNSFDEILPAPGFRLKAEMDAEFFEFSSSMEKNKENKETE